MKPPPIPTDKFKYPLWVYVTIPLTKAELVHYVGKKCSLYDRRCGACKAWRSWEKTGKIKAIVERRADVMGITED